MSDSQAKLNLLRVAAALALTLASGAQAAAVGHVIHISVDGLRSSYLQAVIDLGRAPNLKRFQDEGAWTINARTDFTHTITLPNHASMLTGRPVSQPDGMPATVHHGYTSNVDPAIGETLHNSGNPNLDYVSSVFDVAHDAGLSTALYASKTKFVLFDQSYDDLSGAEHPLGRDKIDTFYAQSDPVLPYSATMQNRFLSDLAANHFDYSFVHYADTDTAGHASGWGSLAYIAAVRAVDAYLAQIFQLVESDPALAGNTAILLTTDHGGIGTGHSNATVPEIFTIPVLAWGAGVGRGDLYAINRASRVDPLTSRPSYSDAVQPIRNGDTGNLALKLLGLGPIPGSSINAAQDLRVAMAGDYNFDGLIDAADYSVWRDSFGSTTALAADGDGSRQIDAGDYDVWKHHFGETAVGPIGASGGVPEPPFGAVFATGIPVMLSLRSRRGLLR
jgi:hypothetical protein